MVLPVGGSNTPGHVPAAALLRGHRASLRVPPTFAPETHGCTVRRASGRTRAAPPLSPPHQQRSPAHSCSSSAAEITSPTAERWVFVDLLWPRCSGRDAEATDATPSKSVINPPLLWNYGIVKVDPTSNGGFGDPDCRACLDSTCDARGKFYAASVVPSDTTASLWKRR